MTTLSNNSLIIQSILFSFLIHLTFDFLTTIKLYYYSPHTSFIIYDSHFFGYLSIVLLSYLYMYIFRQNWLKKIYHILYFVYIFSIILFVFYRINIDALYLEIISTIIFSLIGFVGFCVSGLGMYTKIERFNIIEILIITKFFVTSLTALLYHFSVLSYYITSFILYFLIIILLFSIGYKSIFYKISIVEKTQIENNTSDKNNIFVIGFCSSPSASPRPSPPGSPRPSPNGSLNSFVGFELLNRNNIPISTPSQTIQTSSQDKKFWQKNIMVVFLILISMCTNSIIRSPYNKEQYTDILFYNVAFVVGYFIGLRYAEDKNLSKLEFVLVLTSFVFRLFVHFFLKNSDFDTSNGDFDESMVAIFTILYWVFHGFILRFCFFKLSYVYNSKNYYLPLTMNIFRLFIFSIFLGNLIQ